MGISALIGSVLSSIGITGTAATIGTGVIEGGALGAVEGAITGDPLKGFEMGALSGGLSSGIGVLDPALPKALDVGVGSTIGGLATGEKPVQALEGGLEAGVLSSAFGGTKSPAASGAGPAGGGTASAAGSAAPVSLPATTGNVVTDSSLSIGGVDPNISLASPDTSGDGLGLAGGTSLPGSGGGGAGLPGDVGAGAASGTPTSVGGSLSLSPQTSAGSVSGLPTNDNAVPGTPVTAPATLPANFSDISTPAITSTSTPAPVTKMATNPSTLLAGAGLLGNLLGGDQLPSEASYLKGVAKADAASGEQLESYLDSGQLPQGLQEQVTQATDAAKATIRSQYAARGMSNSSAEAQDLANVDARASAEGAQIALQLYSQGVQSTQVSAQIYQNLLQVQEQEDQQQSQAIANFAGALAGISRGTTGAPTVGLAA